MNRANAISQVKPTPRRGKRYVYIVITRTNGLIPKVIRTFGSTKFNHVSIAFDNELINTYSFARLQYHAPFVGGLVHEYLERYTLGNKSPVPTAVFALNVSAKEFDRISREVGRILGNRDYIYNLFSVASYPLTGGFATSKAYSCAEFVALLLKSLNIGPDIPAHSCRPDDIYTLLCEAKRDSLIYSGDIRGCMKTSTDGEASETEEFFAPFDFKMLHDTLLTLGELTRRLRSKHRSLK